MIVTAAARVALMIGHPVDQTVMPSRFNAWAAERGEDAVMVPLDLAPSGFATGIALLRQSATLRGAVVTAPHKQAAAEAVDTMSPLAQRLGAVNVIARTPDGTLHGGNTDGPGFLAAMEGHGLAPDGTRALLFGCGGAGSAIAAALVAAGAEVDLTDPLDGRAAALARMLGPGARAVAPPPHVDGYGLVVNASAVGLGGSGMVHDLGGLLPGTLVADVVTKPVRTPFLERAQSLGARIQTGEEMAAAQLGLVLRHLGFIRD